MISRSTFSEAGPFSKSVQTFPCGVRSAGLTERDCGSISVDQICWNAPSLSRCLITSCTGFFGQGKRTDSSNVPARTFASSVVAHSPKTELKPRE